MTTLPSDVVKAGMLPLASPAGAASNVTTVARRELRDAVRSRWFLLYTLAFAALGLGVSWVSTAATGGAGLSGFGRTTAGLVNLILLVVPLMAITAGAGSIASDRERGMLSYLLAQPVTRTEVVLGKFVGLAASTLTCICLGLGVCALVLSISRGGANSASIVWLAGLSFLLSLGMLSVGLLISSLARKASVAVATAIFLWLALVFVTDLGLMAGTIAMRLRIEELFAVSLVNPLQVFKMWSLFAGESSLDVLGPAGLYATEEYGTKLHVVFAVCMGAWVALPLGAAVLVFRRRVPL